MEDTREIENTSDLTALVDVDSEPGEPEVYEIGYHIMPTISEKDLEAEVNKITDVLKKLDADFVGERFPAQITLAYPIDKDVDGKRKSFETAHFGWVAFILPADAIIKITEALDAHENLLRYMLVKTSRDQVAATMADPGLDAIAPEEPEATEGETEAAVVGADAIEDETAPAEEAKETA